jgi:hypothetical protein
MVLLGRRTAAAGICAAAALALASVTEGAAAGRQEQKADLGGVVVEHVGNLLSNRFDRAWARMHPADRRAVGRARWERCKRAPDGALTTVRYETVRIVRSRSVRFNSPLHRRVAAAAVTVEVRALLSGVPLDVRDVSHWALTEGRWMRLVESRKLTAYARGSCPA